MNVSALDLTGTVVVITGASRGIGAAMAELLGKCGASVAVNYHASADRAREVADRIEASGGKALPVRADVRDPEQVQSMFDRVAETFGAIHGLINNAHIDFPVKPFPEITWDAFAAKLNGELGAAFHCVQAALKYMLPTGRGKLVFVSSTLSRLPGPGFSAHASAKAAIDSFAKSLALELGPRGITANVIAPGLINTDATAHQPEEMKRKYAAMVPLRRIGLPEDVAGLAAFLMSPLSDYITGQYFSVNGGAFMP
ncbi:MAG TPA: SDR family NAD(P)-dependent oxidoreductase [Candidatus Hydrogenedentes bacterium]|nr:SDR family NAD(P)-dependent oxidoreductase [Candidatus Hydrogenedentota bacterium]